ncbi:LTA synthase family protein [Geomonas sp.]|uniref:LTA synthase family protein n=1 Tax=Geomonas sp. TaxID=2651584 RepID=UPI002B490160|nr:sulfatase-like hydrolase/transferase [Geomonas sp.]HJV34873.1 sulfatase-like hydrolase/transferase [Geomonas sp.]
MGRGAAYSPLRQLKQFSAFLVPYATFWLVYFLICRLAFVLYHGSKLAGFSASTVAGIFAFGAYADLSTACYLASIPYLIWFANSLFPFGAARALIKGYSYLFIVLASLICVGDLQIYREWGTKLNAQALAYLRYPKEAFASAASSPLLLLVAVAILLCFAGIFLYGKLCNGLPFADRPERSLIRLPLFVVFAALIFLGIRGSVGVAAMNPSFVYFSKHPFANHAALNSAWNLFYDAKYYFKEKGNNFVYLADDEAKRRVERLMASGIPNDTDEILTTKRPNIVLFILESFTADVIGALGAEQGIAPTFDELAKDGLLFTDFYANGYRSSYGIPAVLAGYPSTPEGSILTHPLKMERLPTLCGSLKKAGYATQFHYGGDDRFDDMIALLRHSGFDKVVDRESFDKKDMNSKWGAQDHVLFNRVIDDLKGEKAPFFSAMFTLSSHEPFEVPMAPVYQGKDEATLFKNAVHYSDQSLKAFFERARKEPWYSNTLFVFVADHGHPLPLHRYYDFLPERSRIPLLLYGEVLKKEYRGMRKATVASQSDIAATILAQLGLPHDEFRWSNNIFNRNRRDFAFYNFHTGFALRTPEQTTAWDNVSKKVLLRTSTARSEARNAESLKDTQAYMQYLFKGYRAL